MGGQVEGGCGCVGVHTLARSSRHVLPTTSTTPPLVFPMPSQLVIRITNAPLLSSLPGG